ncbi:zinc-binding protein A33-like [Anabas testudineus]|uniref:zinc-binding protein A33-like n=1 Tax=Anabas testudineus TaxID=64144 RepID=UPI000E4573D9|nr:zinc-binding protein A33-like [Anabas testudineus]
MSVQLENDFTCSVCHDICRESVVLSCAHSFCNGCLKTWWNDKPVHECPVCKEVNWLALKNVWETLILERNRMLQSDDFCSLHAEKFKLFCLDHQQPVCVVCRDSKTHTGHRFSPVNEAAQDHRVLLQESLKPLQEKLKLFEQAKENCVQTAEHIKDQTRHTEKQIKEQFKKLHQFLQEEEEARITALREEEEQKSEEMKEKIEALSREISALSETVRVTEEELRAGDFSFLQKYKAAVKRVQQRLPLDEPQLVSGALIDEAKHLGNLTFNIWNKMKEVVSYTPVILDPNTAHPELILSEDLTGVRRGERQKLPENPERFDSTIAVLGSEGFDSGTHSWDVEVGDNMYWFLGVAAKSVKSTRKIQVRPWAIGLCNGKYMGFSPSAQSVGLSIKGKLQKIRVRLDWNQRQLSMSDCDTDEHIHTFTDICTEKLFPYINSGDEFTIKIVPEVNKSDDEKRDEENDKHQDDQVENDNNEDNDVNNQSHDDDN